MKITFLSEINLTQEQKDKAQLWFDRRNARIKAGKELSSNADAWVEEDCCPGSTLSWHIRYAGICTEVKIMCAITGETCDLTIDDDGEINPLQ